MMISLHDPAWLAALLAVPMLVWLRARQRVRLWFVPFASAWSAPPGTQRRNWAVVAQFAAIVLLVVALTRPQQSSIAREPLPTSRDLMFVIDISASMLIEDYEDGERKFSRMELLRPLLDGIIDGRREDRIGAVVFSGRAATLLPLTFDHAELKRRLAAVVPGRTQDGTAIGDALALALARLVPRPDRPDAMRNDAAILLFTDGANNKGLFAPVESAELAKRNGIPIHAFAFGTSGYAELPYFDAAGRKLYRPLVSELDERTLWEIARHTGGRFLHGAAYDAVAKALVSIEAAQPVRVRFRRQIQQVELFPWLAWPGIHRRGDGWAHGATR